MWLVQGHDKDSLGREPHLLISSYLGPSPFRFVQKLTPTALCREWKRLALEPQTRVQILVLSCTNGVILSKSSITLSLGFLIYEGREQASVVQSPRGLCRAPTGCLVLGCNGESGPFFGELSPAVPAAVVLSVIMEKVQGAMGTPQKTPARPL